MYLVPLFVLVRVYLIRPGFALVVIVLLALLLGIGGGSLR